MWIGNKHGMCLLIFILASLCLVGATFTVESQEELEELASFVENVVGLFAHGKITVTIHDVDALN